MVTVELSKGQNTIQRKLKIKLTNIKKKQKKKHPSGLLAAKPMTCNPTTPHQSHTTLLLMVSIAVASV